MLISSTVLQVSTMMGLVQLSPCLLQNGGTLLRRLPLTALIKVGAPATQGGSQQRVPQRCSLQLPRHSSLDNC